MLRRIQQHASQAAAAAVVVGVAPAATVSANTTQRFLNTGDDSNNKNSNSNASSSSLGNSSGRKPAKWASPRPASFSEVPVSERFSPAAGEQQKGSDDADFIFDEQHFPLTGENRGAEQSKIQDALHVLPTDAVGGVVGGDVPVHGIHREAPNPEFQSRLRVPLDRASESVQAKVGAGPKREKSRQLREESELTVRNREAAKEEKSPAVLNGEGRQNTADEQMYTFTDPATGQQVTKKVSELTKMEKMTFFRVQLEKESQEWAEEQPTPPLPNSLPYDDEKFADMILEMEVEGAIDETWQDTKKACIEDCAELTALLNEMKCRDVVCIDVSEKTSNFDFMIFGTCEGSRHIHLVAWSVSQADEYSRIVKPSRGRGKIGWDVVPCGRILVNLMLPNVREEMSFERKWTVSRNMDPLDAAKSPVSEGRLVRAHGLWTLSVNLQDLEDFEADYCKDLLLSQL